MATFNNSGAYSILNTQKGTYYVQGGHYFSPTTFVDLGTTAPTDYQSLSSERSDSINISGGLLDGVTIGPNSTSSAGSSGATITNPTLTGGTINNTPIGQSTPAAGAFTSLNATSGSILGALSAEGINSTGNGQAASITNTGINLSQTFAAETYFDSTRTANNKTADFLWNAGSFSARFKNDAGNSTVTWLSASGGQAAGITGITSNSGSGAWAHTGAFTATSTGGNVLSLDTADVNGSFLKLSNSATVFGYYGSGKALVATGVLADMTVRTETGSILFAQGSTEKARFDTSGRLLIARTADDGSGAILQATGNAKVSGHVTISSGFTVATLPTAATALKGARAFVTDANTPAWNSTVAGGGSSIVPVFCNGTAWVCG